MAQQHGGGTNVGWEKRGKGTYYYRSVRVNGRPRRVYLGRGAEAQEAADQAARRRAERDARQAQRQAEHERWEADDAPLRRLYRFTDLLTKAQLVLAGYYRHDRGEWRRRGRGHHQADS
jgi:hypothetical protein